MYVGVPIDVPATVSMVEWAPPLPVVRAALIAFSDSKSPRDGRAPGGEQDVVRLDVAVHDALRMGVGERTRATSRRIDTASLIPIGPCAEPVAQRVPRRRTAS